MRAGSIRLSVAVAVILLAVPWVAASPARAEADPATVGVGCSDAGFYVTTVTAGLGDTITLIGNGGGFTTCTLSLNGVATASATSFNGDETLVLTIVGAGTIGVSTSLSPTSEPTLTVVAPPTSGPSDFVQQVPLPASGSCGDVKDEAFRYGTAVSGGWGSSWAEWVKPTRGGPVCTRTMHYSSSRGQWTVL